MSFFLRKSIKLGGIRLNISNSGIGFSTGVKGCRIGIDGKGRGYISGGLGPLRYRENLGKISNNTDNDESKTISNNKIHTSFENIPSELRGSDILTLLMLLGGIFILCQIVLIWSFLPLSQEDIIFFLVSLLFCSLPFLGLKKNKRSGLVNKALYYYNKEQYAEALENLYQLNKLCILCNKDTHDFINEYIIDCLKKLKNNEELINFIQNCNFLEDKEFRILETYFDMNYYKKVIEYYLQKQKLLDNYDNKKRVVIIVAISYMKAELYKEAVEYMIKNNDVMWLDEFIIECFENLNDYKGLITYIQKEVSEEKKEEYPAYYSALGNAFLKLGDKETALQVMLTGPVAKRKMIDELREYRYMLAICYEANNDFKSALKQYQKVYAYDMYYKDVEKRIKELKNRKV